MNLTLLSPLAYFAGLLGLAGGLFLLQRLRVRHREVDVVTTMFWQEAVHDARARVLVDRFRHPWAYVLVLALAALMWSAFAAPEKAQVSEGSVVFLLDASAAAGGNESFERAARALSEAVQPHDKETREVWVCGADMRTLLRPGEETLLLEARLEGLEPAATPSGVENALELLAREGRGPTDVVVYTRRTLDPERLALLPEGLRVRRAPALAESDRAASGAQPGEGVANSGITALGIVEAESGAWDCVDVLLEVRTTSSSKPSLVLSLDGVVVDRTLNEDAARLDEGVLRFSLKDLPARGGRLEARLASGDASAFDDLAAVRLPNRSPLRVQLSGGLEPELRATLRRVLERDPGVLLVDSEASLIIRTLEETGNELPALVLSSASSQEEAFLVTHKAERLSAEVLGEASGFLALSQIDATSLAETAQVAIRLGARGRAEGPREVAVWRELFSDRFDFTSSRAFPLFLSGSLRWLSEVEHVRPFVAAAETEIATGGLQREGARALVSMTGQTVAPLAGDYVSTEGERIAVSLLSPSSTRAAGESSAATQGGDSEEAQEVLEASSSATDAVTWILLIALLGLLFEWRQVRTGRMP
ncbi:MAG: hypothetical protein AAF368_01065 [Planctomycetota bacterium]